MLDFSDLGFKCGLEIHQRVDSRKLFCNCYANPSAEERKVDASNSRVLKRRLRAVAGETGAVDVAAAFQAARGQEYTYFVPEGGACAVECDDEPPRDLNVDALGVALSVAKALRCRPVDELHVMRKTVVDGSAVSGFQRTALVARNGELDTPRGRVGIQTVCLEEESAGIVEGAVVGGGVEEGGAAFRLDRLGIPLVEIATDASIRDGAHAREVAEQLGGVLRATGRVQRGLGTIRQDLNVSIEGGARVEVKGAQELDAIPKIIANEVRRQLELLEIRVELEKRGATVEGVGGKFVDVSSVFKQTASGLVKKALARGEGVFGLKLAGFAGLLGREVMPGHRFGTELAHYARQAAGVRGLVHSDEDSGKYGFGAGELAALRTVLACSSADAWVVVTAGTGVAERALAAVRSRAAAALAGVPEETRRADGEKSVFLRPLPGAARLYPETDVPPLLLAPLWASASAPEPLAAKRARFEELGVSPQLAERLVRSAEWPLFESLVARSRADANAIAATLVETLVGLRREGVPVDGVSEDVLARVFVLLREGRIVKAAVPELLKAAAAGEDVARAVVARGLERVSGAALEALVREARAKGGDVFSVVVREHRLRVDAEELRSVVGKAGGARGVTEKKRI